MVGPSQDRVGALRAVAHPVRLQMLSLLTGADMSAAEVARELGLTHANASYHLRVLASVGEVVVTGQEKIRGGVAKRYRHPWDSPELLESASAAGDQLPFVRTMGDELVRRFASRAHQGSNRLTDAEMWVRPEVWDEVTALVDRASRLVHAEANPPRSPGTVHVNMTAALFTMDEPMRDSPDDPAATKP